MSIPSEQKTECKLLNEAQTARLLGIDRSTLCRLRQKGAIGYYRIGGKSGGRVLFNEQHINAFLARSEHIPDRPELNGRGH
jgi:excisionase family DNA binding protein